MCKHDVQVDCESRVERAAFLPHIAPGMTPAGSARITRHLGLGCPCRYVLLDFAKCMECARIETEGNIICLAT